MWPFKRKPKAVEAPPKPEPIRGIPTVAARHQTLRDHGYEPVADDDGGTINWVKREGDQ
jgi:hypothetical protein